MCSFFIRAVVLTKETIIIYFERDIKTGPTKYGRSYTGKCTNDLAEKLS